MGATFNRQQYREMEMTKKQTGGADWNNTTVSDIYVKDIKTKTDEMNDGQIRELIRVVQKCDKNKLNDGNLQT